MPIKEKGGSIFLEPISSFFGVWFWQGAFYVYACAFFFFSFL
jgi:hypothetical protein